MGSDGLDRDDEHMTLGQRAFWTLVSASSAIMLYLCIVCAMPRGPAGY